MKTKYWLILLGTLLALCIGLSVFLLMPGEDAAFAQISSDGQIMHLVDLRFDREITITTSDGGRNTITIEDGKIAVTNATCPDHYCMDRGFCSGGSPIVCLPNRLVITFQDEQDVDFVAG